VSAAASGAPAAPPPPVGAEGTTPTPARGRLARLRARLRERPDSEHEQALIRILFAFIIGGYMAGAALMGAGSVRLLGVELAICAASLVASTALFLHLVARPAVNVARRFLGLLIDTVGVTGLMVVGGLVTAPLYPVLLWIILGHGFRFGRRQLLVAAVMAMILFAGVIHLNAEWRAVPALDVSMMLALIVLPAYFAALLKRLHAAIERAEEASRTKSRFLATMSHEFRTPLNAIVGMSDLLESTRLDHDQRDMAVTVQGAARSLLALVNDLLDVARIEAGQVGTEEAPFDLFRRLAAVRALLSHQAAERGLHLRLRVDPETPWQLVGNVRLLHQVLVNLVANAIRFTREGGVTIAVRPLAPEPERVWLRLEVIDTGIGIAAEAQARIFERFEQADEETRIRYGGSGLGLAIVRELVGLMRGRLGVTSEPGRGSCFWVELPLRPQAAPGTEAIGSGRAIVLGAAAEALAQRLARLAVAADVAADPRAIIRLLTPAEGRAVVVAAGGLPQGEAALLADLLASRPAPEAVDLITVGLAAAPGSLPALAELPAEPDDAALVTCLRAALAEQPGEHTRRGAAAMLARRPSRVLVAEDNRTNRKVIGRILERAGHKAVMVDDGAAVIERLEDERFDIVLMDLNMPGTGGVEAMKLLRFAHAAEDLPPVVVLSADATEETRRRCASAGFSGYLTKPVDSALLIRTIDELVGERSAAAASASTMAAAHRPMPAVATATDNVVPHPALEGARPVVDRAKLMALAALDTGDGFLASLIDDFLGDAAMLVQEIEAAAKAGRMRELRDRAHALRSSAAHLGGTALFELCLSWRDLGDEALAARGRTELARLRREFDRLRAALLDFKQQSHGGTTQLRGRH
jgi:two-component system sensor histidine kinase RpfC